MSMYGDGTPKERIYQDLSFHAREIGWREVIKLVLSILSDMAEYYLDDLSVDDKET